MQTVALSPILTLLAWSVVLLLVQALQATTGILEHGLSYALSPQDEGLEVKGLYAGRINRAFFNLLETYPAFVALALALAITGKAGGTGLLGAQIWFWARVFLCADLYRRYPRCSHAGLGCLGDRSGDDADRPAGLTVRPSSHPRGTADGGRV